MLGRSIVDTHTSVKKGAGFGGERHNLIDTVLHLQRSTLPLTTYIISVLLRFIMDQFNQIFEHFPQYRVIICKSCGWAVLPKNVKRHLKDKHHGLQPKTRKDVTRVVLSIETLARSENQIIYPDRYSDPVPHLTTYSDGLKCIAKIGEDEECGWVLRGVQNIQHHAREEHDWVNTRGSGRFAHRDVINLPKPWIENVHCQRFLQMGGTRKLFEVQAPRLQRGPRTESGADALVRGVNEQMDAVEAEAEGAEINGIINGDISRFEANAWLARTGWAKHLSGRDRRELLALTALPTDDEHALQRVCQMVEVVMFRAQQKSQPELVGWPVVDFISRREFSSFGETRYSEKPMNTKQLGDTIVKYTKV
jgi:hypothetical protein